MPFARSIILKSNWTIATSASFRLLSSSAGLIRVSTNSWSVGVEPYKLHLYYLILLLIIFTQNSTVLHGTVGSVSPSTRVDIKSSLRQIIAWIRHIHWSSKFRSCFIHLWKLLRVVFLLASYWLVTWLQATRISYPFNRCWPTLLSRSISPHLPTWPVMGSVPPPLGWLIRKVGIPLLGFRH